MGWSILHEILEYLYLKPDNYAILVWIVLIGCEPLCFDDNEVGINTLENKLSYEHIADS